MIRTFFTTFDRLISFCYEKIFQERMTEEAKNMVNNFLYVIIGTSITVCFSFTFTIVVGRTLGPTKFGKFGLVESISVFLVLPIAMGLPTAMEKYNAEQENSNRQIVIISTTYLIILSLAITWILIYLVFSNQISKQFFQSENIFYLSVILAVIYTFYRITRTTLRSLHQIKRFALFQPIAAIISLISLMIFFVNNSIFFESAIFALCLGYLITGGLIFVLLSFKYVRFKFDKQWGDKLLRYGVYSMIQSLSYTFYSNIDKILLFLYFSSFYVGIYRAYYSAFMMIVIYLVGIFVSVFFPFASKYNDKEKLFKRINKIMPLTIICLFSMIFITGFIIFNLYGVEFQFDLKIAILFGVAAIVMWIKSVYEWLMNSVGKQGIRITAIAGVVLAITNISLNVLLIPILKIEGAIISLIIPYLLSIIIILSKRKYFLESDEHGSSQSL